jgi:uncharacterized Zn finger protein (UPF0148 family)
MKVWAKACPRCSGDLHEELAIYDSYVFCVKCRYTLTHREKASLTAAREPAREAAGARSETA